MVIEKRKSSNSVIIRRQKLTEVWRDIETYTNPRTGSEEHAKLGCASSVKTDLFISDNGPLFLEYFNQNEVILDPLDCLDEDRMNTALKADRYSVLEI